MLTFDYVLDPAWDRAEVDLAAADEMVLRYDCFLGDVVFVVGEADFSARWGWVPILDFAVALDGIVDLLVGEGRFEFTESDAAIDFRRDGDVVQVSTNYMPGSAVVPLVELQAATDAFLRRVVADLTARHPELARNTYVAQLGLSS
jgi:hypothetical protein